MLVDDNANASSFWDFTTSAYAREGVQSAVIELQEKHACDVNVLFLCCYIAATKRGRLTNDDFEIIDNAVGDWKNDVTEQLRAVRNRIKESARLTCLPGATELRARVISAEIESERVSQSILESLFATRTVDDTVNVLENAVANLSVYLVTICCNLDKEDEKAIVDLLCATLTTETVETQQAMRSGLGCDGK